MSFLSTFNPVLGRMDLAGLDYERDSGVLYAVYDSANLMPATTASSTLIPEWTLPGSNQEGVALHGSNLFVAEDSGDIVRYAPFAAVPEPADITLVASGVLIAASGRRRRGLQP